MHVYPWCFVIIWFKLIWSNRLLYNKQYFWSRLSTVVTRKGAYDYAEMWIPELRQRHTARFPRRPFTSSLSLHFDLAEPPGELPDFDSFESNWDISDPVVTLLMILKIIIMNSSCSGGRGGVGPAHGRWLRTTYSIIELGKAGTVISTQ